MGQFSFLLAIARECVASSIADPAFLEIAFEEFRPTKLYSERITAAQKR